MHSQKSGPTSQGGRNSTPLAFFPGVCSGGYLFSSGGPTPTTPANFYPVHDLLLVELFHVEYYRDLQMWVRGHSRSLKTVPFESLGTVSYSLP